MNLTEIAVKRPVFTMILYIAVTVFGLVALSRLPLDLYPEMEQPVISIVTAYPGASSWDVEDKVTKPLEKSLGILTGLKEITSKSLEGTSVVFLQFVYGTNLDEAANDIRTSIDFVKKTLPDGLADPMLFKFNTAYMPVYFGAITSDLVDAPKERKYLEDHVMQTLQALPGVGSASLFNVAAEEVQVQLNLDELEKRGIPVPQVTQVLAASNISMPAGKIEDRAYELPVRVPAEFETVDEIRDLIVGAAGGQPVHLRDVATVLESHHEMRAKSNLDSRAVAVFMVQKQSGGNTVEVTRGVKQKLAELEPQLGKGIRFVEIYDGGRLIQGLVSNLYESLFTGGLLVILVVVAFLRRFRASLIVALSIPGSLIIAFLLMYLKGYTLNAVSLMAMTLAVGMVVDNSIVVLENINRHLDWGHSPREASIRGTTEVGLAVSASTFTTIGIFLPMIFVTGLVSMLFGQLAFVIVITLVASLVTSVFLTPMLTARLLKPGDLSVHGRSGARWLDRIDDAYARLARKALAHRGKVYLLSLAILVASGISLARVGFDFLPVFDDGAIRITLELPVGTSVERSMKLAETLVPRFREVPEVQRVYYQAGEDEEGWGVIMGQKEGSHVLQFTTTLTDINLGRRGIQAVAEDLRKVVAGVDGLIASDVTYGEQGGGSLGTKPLVVEVLGNDYDRMKAAAREVEAALKAQSGTRDVSASVPYEKPEVQIRLDRRRMALLGVTAYQASDAVRTALYGSKVTRFRGGGQDIEVLVRLQASDRVELDRVGRILVPTVAGGAVALRNFSEITSGFSPLSIEHAAQRRVLRVASNLEGVSLGEATAEFEKTLPTLREKYGDLAFRYGGQAKEQQENFLDMLLMLALGCFVTYLIMAAQFESLMDPLVIMFSVPFAFTGSFLGLSLYGERFNVLAFLGMIMLVGIVVNNAIVLVDYLNFMRSEGTPLMEAVVETARRRLRPIAMTTVTTLFGIIPLAVAKGEGSELWKPIGVTMLGGLTFSSLVTLILIPCMYVTFERFRKKGRFDKAPAPAPDRPRSEV